MKLSETFERAAANMDIRETGGCCDALRVVRASYRATDYFSDLFKRNTTSGYWWGSGTGCGVWMDEKSRAPRVLALCFAAAMAKSEGL